MLCNDNRPTTFEEYVGQEGASGYIKAVIKDNKHPSGILINGSPGTGKTTLAHLYVKATLCENRKQGEVEPCGKCDSCLSDIEKGEHANITYYRITEATTFKEAVGDLIAISKSSPVITHDNNRDDNFRRFVIIDELQNASRQSISPFLDSLEFASEKVTVVLISMDLDKMDNVVRDAIESRCIELSLDKLSTSQISSKLQEGSDDLHPDVANLIAYLSNGNQRRAWSLLEYFGTQKPILELTPNFVAKQKMGGLNKDKCFEILDSIQTKEWADTEILLSSITNNSIQAIDYILNVIVNEDLNSNGIELVSALSFWLQCDYKTPLLSLFRPFQGKVLIGDIIVEEVIEQVPLPVSKEPTITKVHSSSTEKAKMNKDILNQLSNITGKKIETPNKYVCKSLSFTKWSQFLEHYANNN